MHRLCTAAVLALCLSATAHAATLTDVRPLPGYACAQLNLTPAQLTDPHVGVPIRNTPSPQAPAVSFAGNTLIVQDPAQPSGRFVQVLRFTGQVGWIEAKWLRPWANIYDPTAKCVPSMMSNGKPGFGFTH